MEPVQSAPGLALREADASDLGDLVRLARAFYEEDSFTTGAAELRKNFEVLLGARNAHTVAAVEDGGRPFAFALTTTMVTLESGVAAEIQDLYVGPEHRRSGVAAALIQEASAWAREQGASRLEVVIAPNGKDVRHLFSYYAKRGFVDEGRRILVQPLD